MEPIYPLLCWHRGIPRTLSDALLAGAARSFKPSDAIWITSQACSVPQLCFLGPLERMLSCRQCLAQAACASLAPLTQGCLGVSCKEWGAQAGAAREEALTGARKGPAEPGPSRAVTTGRADLDGGSGSRDRKKGMSSRESQGRASRSPKGEAGLTEFPGKTEAGKPSMLGQGGFHRKKAQLGWELSPWLPLHHALLLLTKAKTDKFPVHSILPAIDRSTALDVAMPVSGSVTVPTDGSRWAVPVSHISFVKLSWRFSEKHSTSEWKKQRSASLAARVCKTGPWREGELCRAGAPQSDHSCGQGNMNDNLLESWSDLDELKGARSLETVYLERNPLQKDPQYRRKVMLALPSVRQIDATFVRF
ncbi:hypothetical protein H8959_012609 [Pygathrix nigripes]